MMTAPAPTRVSGASVIPLRRVAFTPRKQWRPIRTWPETTTCELMKQWSSITESWPMWLPLQRVTLLPMRTKGWTVLSSRMKQLSPGGSSAR